MAILEQKVYGVNACRALWQSRAQDIIRVYVTKSRMKAFSDLLKWCSQQKLAYHVVETDALAQIALSIHHEGVLILARVQERPIDLELETMLLALPSPSVALYLDGVQNPHNIGAIIRVAAHFGCFHIIGQKGQLPRLSPSAARVAEGGVEHVIIGEFTHPKTSLAKLIKNGFAFAATSSHSAKNDLYLAELPPRIIFALGHEIDGMSRELLKITPLSLAIPGTGQVESLNVSVAAGILLGEHWRRYPRR